MSLWITQHGSGKSRVKIIMVGREDGAWVLRERDVVSKVLTGREMEVDIVFKL